MLAIRIANPGDAKVLSQFAESTFRATYGALNNADHMATHCRNSFGEQFQAAEISNPDMVTLLCEDKGTLIGYAQLLWGEAPDFISSRNPGEIQRLYVGDDWHGKGGDPQRDIVMARSIASVEIT